MKPRKPLTRDEALLKMASLCARSEQAPSDIMRKLAAAGLDSADIESVIGELTDRKFLDELRYAIAFSRDKVRFSSWGRLKIRMGLIAKRIQSATIEEAWREVDQADYLEAAKKAAASAAKNLDLSRREEAVKLYRHLLSRGFESDLASRIVKEIRNSD